MLCLQTTDLDRGRVHTFYSFGYPGAVGDKKKGVMCYRALEMTADFFTWRNCTVLPIDNVHLAFVQFVVTYKKKHSLAHSVCVCV